MHATARVSARRYSTDAALYWGGIANLIGEPTAQTTSPILDSMAADHTAYDDADDIFEVHTYYESARTHTHCAACMSTQQSCTT